MALIPWVAIGLSVIMAGISLFLDLKKKKAAKAERLAALMAGTLTEDDAPQEEEDTHQVGKGMSVGVLIGVCVAAVFHFELLLGLSIGMFGGTILGLTAKREA